MGEQTTITLSPETKSILDEDRTQSWDEHLLKLHDQYDDTVTLSSEQVDEIARECADKTIERFPGRN